MKVNGGGAVMGLFDKLLKAMAGEMAKSPQQREAEKIERQYGVPIESVRTFKTDAEYQEFMRQEQEIEDRIIDRLYDAGQKILDRVWDYQDDYVDKRMLK